MTRTRDLALAAVAGVAVVALAVTGWADPPASDSIITGIVALGAGALGRISAAGPTPTTEG